MQNSNYKYIQVSKMKIKSTKSDKKLLSFRVIDWLKYKKFWISFLNFALSYSPFIKQNEVSFFLVFQREEIKIIMKK